MKELLFTLILANSFSAYQEPNYDIVESIKNKTYAGLSCGVTLDYLIIKDLFEPIEIVLAYDLNGKNKLNETQLPICYPDDSGWFKNFIIEHSSIIDLFFPSYFRWILVDSILLISLFIVVKYAKSPYGNSMSLYSMIINAKNFYEFVDFFKSTPTPTLSEALLAGPIEEIQCRLILQSISYDLMKFICSFFYENAEYIENNAYYFSLLLASSTFGLAHLLNPSPQWAQVFFATIAGYYLGAIYFEHGIFASTICHSLSNALLVAYHRLIVISLLAFSSLIKWYSYCRLPYSIQETNQDASFECVY